MDVYVHVHVYVSVYVYLYVCVCIYIYIYFFFADDASTGGEYQIILHQLSTAANLS